MCCTDFRETSLCLIVPLDVAEAVLTGFGEAADMDDDADDDDAAADDAADDDDDDNKDTVAAER